MGCGGGGGGGGGASYYSASGNTEKAVDSSLYSPGKRGRLSLSSYLGVMSVTASNLTKA